jgi:hypothetical protein
VTQCVRRWFSRHVVTPELVLSEVSLTTGNQGSAERVYGCWNAPVTAAEDRPMQIKPLEQLRQPDGCRYAGAHAGMPPRRRSRTANVYE